MQTITIIILYPTCAGVSGRARIQKAGTWAGVIQAGAVDDPAGAGNLEPPEGIPGKARSLAVSRGSWLFYTKNTQKTRLYYILVVI